MLYKAFPIETEVIVDELGENLDEETTDNYFATIRFLQREGFIHYQKLHYSAFKGVVLTAKGLKILDTMADALADEKARGAVIREVIKLSV
ncbi:hypothetical protein THIOM_004522 [Candidatus Thiomargarita nelsonii]|uniref:Uncharacterized protein n=1 Tax=Candidatus Thiomargarita nelsonii TaxID=1003181 RepID=A0A176RVR6_9GAMM|nr:hypothetical protein THIOM_004522 [Candidatus Thiomargarita nelsonii]